MPQAGKKGSPRQGSANRAPGIGQAFLVPRITWPCSFVACLSPAVVDSFDLEEGDSSLIDHNKKQATCYGEDVTDDGEFSDGFGFPIEISVIDDATNII